MYCTYYVVHIWIKDSLVKGHDNFGGGALHMEPPCVQWEGKLCGVARANHPCSREGIPLPEAAFCPLISYAWPYPALQIRRARAVDRLHPGVGTPQRLDIPRTRSPLIKRGVYKGSDPIQTQFF
jgi:hypothetical protein